MRAQTGANKVKGASVHAGDVKRGDQACCVLGCVPKSRNCNSLTEYTTGIVSARNTESINNSSLDSNGFSFCSQAGADQVKIASVHANRIQCRDHAGRVLRYTSESITIL